MSVDLPAKNTVYTGTPYVYGSGQPYIHCSLTSAECRRPTTAWNGQSSSRTENGTVGPEHIVGPLLAHCWHLVGPEHIVGTLLAQFIQGTSLLALDTCMKKGRTDAGSLGAVLHLLGPYRTECLVPMHCLTTGFPAWLLQA